MSIKVVFVKMYSCLYCATGVKQQWQTKQGLYPDPTHALHAFKLSCRALSNILAIYWMSDITAHKI